MDDIITLWKISLYRLLTYYEANRGPLRTFYPKLFLFFIFLNITCYWWAMFTGFFEYLHGHQGWHYFKVSFPVGFLGAIFDSLSFFVTVYIIRRAIKSQNTLEYLSHLSIDLIIAIIATFWVLLVFIISGWLIHILTPAVPVFGEENLVTRQTRYSDMLINALLNPFDNLRNIYFGLIMGFSASLPTFIHIALFVRSGAKVVFKKLNPQ
ncbi:MAG: hypothetical protein ACI8V2_004901 [Candidatus Latescibacterota bacterium]|jgi:hypothetical protein